MPSVVLHCPEVAVKKRKKIRDLTATERAAIASGKATAIRGNQRRPDGMPVGRPFAPGESGNVAGKPKEVREVVDALRLRGAELVARLLALSLPASIRTTNFEALKLALAYSLGKPPATLLLGAADPAAGRVQAAAVGLLEQLQKLAATPDATLPTAAPMKVEAPAVDHARRPSETPPEPRELRPTWPDVHESHAIEPRIVLPGATVPDGERVVWCTKCRAVTAEALAAECPIVEVKPAPGAATLSRP